MERLIENIKNGHHNFHFDFFDDKCMLRFGEHQKVEPVHTHDFNELVIVLRGTGIHVVDDEKYPIIRGDAFVIIGDHKHGFIDAKDLLLANFIFTKNYFIKLKQEFENLPAFNTLFISEPRYRKNQKFQSKLHLDSKQLNKIYNLAKLIKEEEDEKLQGYKKIKEKILEQIIIYICRYYTTSGSSTSKSLMKIGPVIDYIENNLNESFNVEMLAKKAFMSTSHFRYCFKKITGLAPCDFINRVKIKKATDLIVNFPELNVTEIALRSGFDNSAYFSRQFKKITGLAPIAFIKKQRALAKPSPPLSGRVNNLREMT